MELNYTWVCWETDSIKRDSLWTAETLKETKNMLKKNDKQVCTSIGGQIKKKDILIDEIDKQVRIST